jgi:hypothetical protein
MHSCPDFQPDLTPQQMLELGVFGGAYFPDSQSEWFAHAKLSSEDPSVGCNFFGIFASQPLKVWQKKGWIHPADPLGWFQWYCRYSLGRRLPEEDTRQIKRCYAMRRHVAQVRLNCRVGDISCRPKQRQALLQWGYDSRKL